jgi:hypothetical protein
MSNLKRYTLTAERNAAMKITVIDAEDDSDAMWKAIKFILDTSYQDKQGLWAKGLVTLRDGKRIIHTMPEKTQEVNA